LIERDGEAEHAARVTQEKTEDLTGSQEAWRLRDVQVRQSERTMRQLKRKSMRRDDERRLAEQGDRTTYAWTRS
jgi:hypothetical protein